MSVFLVYASALTKAVTQRIKRKLLKRIARLNIIMDARELLCFSAWHSGQLSGVKRLWHQESECFTPAKAGGDLQWSPGKETGTSQNQDSSPGRPDCTGYISISWLLQIVPFHHTLAKLGCFCFFFFFFAVQRNIWCTVFQMSLR